MRVGECSDSDAWRRTYDGIRFDHVGLKSLEFFLRSRLRRRKSHPAPIGGGIHLRKAARLNIQGACRGAARPPCSQDRAEARSPVFFSGGRARKEMGEFQQYFDVILFAMVAAFLVLRLRSVLGRRTGNERRRELFVRRARPAAENRPTLVEPEPGPGAAAPAAPPADGVAEGLNQIRRADPSFDPSSFVEGARTAFEMIVGAFANGDKEALRPLLS